MHSIQSAASLAAIVVCRVFGGCWGSSYYSGPLPSFFLLNIISLWLGIFEDGPTEIRRCFAFEQARV